MTMTREVGPAFDSMILGITKQLDEVVASVGRLKEQYDTDLKNIAQGNGATILITPSIMHPGVLARTGRTSPGGNVAFNGGPRSSETPLPGSAETSEASPALVARDMGSGSLTNSGSGLAAHRAQPTVQLARSMGAGVSERNLQTPPVGTLSSVPGRTGSMVQGLQSDFTMLAPLEIARFRGLSLDTTESGDLISKGTGGTTTKSMRSTQRSKVSKMWGNAFRTVGSNEQILHLQLAPGWEEHGRPKQHKKFDHTRLDFDFFAKSQYEVEQRLEDKKRWSPCNFTVWEPTSIGCLLWAVVEMLLLAHDLVTIPTTAFGVRSNAAMIYISAIFWTLDVPGACMKGYITRTGDVELRFSRVVRHYLKTAFLFDSVLAAIEWLNIAMQDRDGSNQRQVASSSRVIRLLRLSRLLKVAKIQKLVEIFTQRIHSNLTLTALNILKVAIAIYLLIHIVSCGWYFVCDAGESSQSWVRQDDAIDETFLFLYTSSVYWTLTQIGFGNSALEPQNDAELMYSMGVGCLGLFVCSWLIGSIVILMTRLIHLQKEQREQRDQLRDFMCKHRISWPLRNRIWTFLQQIRKKAPKHALQESNIALMQHLPKAATLELRAEVFVPALTTHPFFSTYAVSKANKFAMHRLVEKNALQEVAFNPEHELFADGEDALFMYFVTSGEFLYCSGNQHMNALMATLTLPMDASRSSGQSKPRPSHKMISMTATTTGGGVSHQRTEDRVAMGAVGWQMLEEGFYTSTCRAGDWMCEPALWLRWLHLGWAVAKGHAEVVTLDVLLFQRTLQDSLPQAAKYAKLFLAYANRHRDSLDDVFNDVSHLRWMAQDTFEPPLKFDIAQCVPHKLSNVRSEWQPADRRAWNKVWSSVFREAQLCNRSAMIATLTADMKNDVVMVYQTIFSNVPFAWASEEERISHRLKIGFLKRFFITLAVCSVKFSQHDNSEAVRPWPYPLASTICHGGRMLLRLQGIRWQDFIAFLLFGSNVTEDDLDFDDRSPPSPIYVRRAATHGCRLVEHSTQILEQRARGKETLRHGHMGMDLPLGGLGNPAPMASGQYFVGPSGVPYKRRLASGNRQYCMNVQHGHLYLRADDYGTLCMSPLAVLAQTTESNQSWASRESIIERLTGLRQVARLSSMGLADLPGQGRGSTFGDLPVSRDPDLLQNDWEPIPRISSTGLLKDIIANSGVAEDSIDEESVEELRRLLGKELVLEYNSEGELRLRGRLVFLHLESRTEARSRVLVQTQSKAKPFGQDYGTGYMGGAPDGTMTTYQSATSSFMTPPSRSYTTEDMLRRGQQSENLGDRSFLMEDVMSEQCEDPRIVTMLSRVEEPWMTTVARYCQEVFNLCSAAISQIIESCHDEADEAYLCEVECPTSVAWYHKNACCGLPLSYKALRVKAVIGVVEEDHHIMGDLLCDSFSTTEMTNKLKGFGDCTTELGGFIIRQWQWLRSENAAEAEGFARPSIIQKLPNHLVENVAALLIGVEASAPLKEDCFGQSHSVDGRSKDLSAFGKRKWTDYRKGGMEVPASLGGIRATVDAAKFQLIQNIADQILSLEENSKEEIDFFKSILVNSDHGVKEFLAQRDLMEPADEIQSGRVIRHAGSMVDRYISNI